MLQTHCPPTKCQITLTAAPASPADLLSQVKLATAAQRLPMLTLMLNFGKLQQKRLGLVNGMRNYTLTVDMCLRELLRCCCSVMSDGHVAKLYSKLYEIKLFQALGIE